MIAQVQQNPVDFKSIDHIGALCKWVRQQVTFPTNTHIRNGVKKEEKPLSLSRLAQWMERKNMPFPHYMRKESAAIQRESNWAEGQLRDFESKGAASKWCTPEMIIAYAVMFNIQELDNIYAGLLTYFGMLAANALFLNNRNKNERLAFLQKLGISKKIAQASRALMHLPRAFAERDTAKKMHAYRHEQQRLYHAHVSGRFDLGRA